MATPQPDESGSLEADRDRLRKELNNLIETIAHGISPATVAPQIKQREAELDEGRSKLRLPKPERPDVDKLRAALLQRAGECVRPFAPSRRLRGWCCVAYSDR